MKRSNRPPLAIARSVSQLTERLISFIAIVTALACCHTAVASDDLETAGDIGQVILPAAALGATFYYADMTGFKEFAYAGLTTLTAVQILKHTVHRTRPNGHDESFPSGHTAAAFLGAGFLQMRYGWAYGVPAYLAAAFTGYSRVESHNHWTSDVLAGAAIGIAANLVFTGPFSQQVTVVPYSNFQRKESGIVMTTTL